MATAGNLFRRNWSLIVVLLFMLLIIWLVFILRAVLLPFILALIFAYIILPGLKWIERRLPKRGRALQTKRVSLILLSYLLFLAIVGSLGFAIWVTLAPAVANLLENAPDIFDDAIANLQRITQSISDRLPPQLSDALNQYTQNAGENIANGIANLISSSLAVLPSTIGTAFNLIALPIILFYLLKDWDRLKQGFYASLPSWAYEHTRNIFAIVDNVMGRYIRSILVLGAIVGLADLIGLLIVGVPLAPVLGVLAGIFELVPLLGPWISGILAAIVTLALAPEKLFWMGIVLASVQILENQFLVPRIQGGFLKVNPAIAITLLFLGGYLAGIWGLILAVPLAATFMRIYDYVRKQGNIRQPEEPISS